MNAIILVLDAEPIVRSVVTKILERDGYSVRATGDLNAALQIAKECIPDLLLTNLYVPGTTGHDAAKVLRGICPKMRVLMVAGLPDDKRVCDRAEDEDFELFPKPFSPDELSTKVREVLAGPMHRGSVTR